MSDHTYKKVEIVGSSENSIEEAIQNALDDCSQTVKNINWFEVTEIRGHLVNGKMGHYQVGVKVGFRVEN